VASNLIEQDFSQALPNQVWTTDVTYLAANQGWLYLMVMLDFFSRQVVGWSIKPQMTQHLLVDALRIAWFRRRPAAGLVMHSDRGSQYFGYLFQSALKAYGMRSSMSRKGDCWDNAQTESVRGLLKRACIYGQRFRTREEAKAAVMNWLAFYNATRLPSRLDYLSPMQFEKN
jgi:putative transposase